MKRGEHSPEATKEYKRNQRRKKRYMELREELQLEGVIPTEPDGAIRDERVDTTAPLLPEIVRQAVKENWATPDVAKGRIVQSLLEPFYNKITTIAEDGTAIEIPPSPKLLNELARTLAMLDKDQYERDHPKEGKDDDRGATTFNFNVNTKVVEKEDIKMIDFEVVVPDASNKSDN